MATFVSTTTTTEPIALPAQDNYYEYVNLMLYVLVELQWLWSLYVYNTVLQQICRT